MSRLRVGARIDATVVAAPMHGEVKVRSEGWRTRDAHLLQWLEHDFPDMVVVSRPEPFPRLTLARRRHDLGSPATWVSPEPFAPSAVWSGKRWWVNSKKWLPDLSDQGVLLAWNPLAAAHYRSASPGRRLVFDFLDDWLIHPLFAPIRSAVNQAYEAIADHAVVIFCNSEATFARAEALGRSDALLMPNGCDPEIFSVESSAAGDRTVLGYAGKLGSRLDTDLILEVANALPSLRLVFAGPVLERAIADRILRAPNCELIGDVHYRDYPGLLASFDIGWVPHRVGDGEVGGDAIKIYEYRAAGLPVVSTPIVGAGRLDGVRVCSGGQVIEGLKAIIGQADGPRIQREPARIPLEHTWRSKAARIARELRAMG